MALLACRFAGTHGTHGPWDIVRLHRMCTGGPIWHLDSGIEPLSLHVLVPQYLTATLPWNEKMWAKVSYKLPDGREGGDSEREAGTDGRKSRTRYQGYTGRVRQSSPELAQYFPGHRAVKSEEETRHFPGPWELTGPNPRGLQSKIGEFGRCQNDQRDCTSWCVFTRINSIPISRMVLLSITRSNP